MKDTELIALNTPIEISFTLKENTEVRIAAIPHAQLEFDIVLISGAETLG